MSSVRDCVFAVCMVFAHSVIASRRPRNSRLASCNFREAQGQQPLCGYGNERRYAVCVIWESRSEEQAWHECSSRLKPKSKHSFAKWFFYANISQSGALGIVLIFEGGLSINFECEDDGRNMDSMRRVVQNQVQGKSLA